MTPLRKNDIQVLDDLDHVLLRSEMYVGSKATENIPTYVYENDRIVFKEICQIPALLKLYDEIISNSVDEAIRTNFKYANKIKVTFDNKTGMVTIEDNGRGLPIEFDENLQMYTPEVIFTQLRAGSNFDDKTKGMEVGMNGVGGSLVPIFSKWFQVETSNGSKHYKQVFEHHTKIKGKPKVKDFSGNFTIISYIPNYDYFNANDEVKVNIEKLYYKRVKDLAFAYPEITFWFNKEKISFANLKQHLKSIHEIFEYSEIENGRLGVFCSETEFQQMSFVNGADTKRGGVHVDNISNIIVDHIRTFIRKKHKLEVKPIDIRSKLFILFSMRMIAPKFDSQTKERCMTMPPKAFFDELLSKKFLDSVLRNDEIILPIVEMYKLKQQANENVKLKQLSTTKKKLRIEKYYPATDNKKWLTLAEGDSALNGIMSVVGRKDFSYFPLRGKPINSLEVKLSKITENEEFKNIVQILNLRLDKDEQSNLNYENILIASDSDTDGIHIQSLILCLFYRFGKSLLTSGRISFLRTPIVAAYNKKGEMEEYFFSFDEYKAATIKSSLNYVYYKGLATWKKQDLKNLFDKKGLSNFIQKFTYDDKAEMMIKNWMSEGGIDYRKQQLRGREFDLNKI